MKKLSITEIITKIFVWLFIGFVIYTLFIKNNPFDRYSDGEDPFQDVVGR